MINFIRNVCAWGIERCPTLLPVTGFNSTEWFDMKIKPTNAYEPTRIHYITTVLNRIRLHVSATLVSILREMYKGYVTKASKTRGKYKIIFFLNIMFKIHVKIYYFPIYKITSYTRIFFLHIYQK